MKIKRRSRFIISCSSEKFFYKTDKLFSLYRQTFLKPLHCHFAFYEDNLFLTQSLASVSYPSTSVSGGNLKKSLLGTSGFLKYDRYKVKYISFTNSITHMPFMPTLKHRVKNPFEFMSNRTDL